MPLKADMTSIKVHQRRNHPEDTQKSHFSVQLCIFMGVNCKELSVLLGRISYFLLAFKTSSAPIFPSFFFYVWKKVVLTLKHSIFK